MIKDFHQKLAELFMVHKNGKMTEAQEKEFYECLKLNFEYCWKLAYLENQSLLASMTNDTDWQFEVCIEIQKNQI